MMQADFLNDNVISSVCKLLSSSKQPDIVLAHSSRSTKLLYTGQVTSWVGDCLYASKPSQYVPNHLGQFSLPSLLGR